VAIDERGGATSAPGTEVPVYVNEVPGGGLGWVDGFRINTSDLRTYAMNRAGGRVFLSPRRDFVSEARHFNAGRRSRTDPCINRRSAAEDPAAVDV
jgi:hypothetical protein